MGFLQSLQLDGFLSFPPGTSAIPLTGLNLLIGPNGSGKSNLLEAIEVLQSTPTGLASFIREGGTAQEWLWKGEPAAKYATLEARIERNHKLPVLRYSLRFAAAGLRMNVLEESLVESRRAQPSKRAESVLYQRKKKGAALAVTERRGLFPHRKLIRIKPDDLVPDESIFSQRKDPALYPELTGLAQQFGRIQTFRDWSFGRAAPLRRPQRGDLQIDELLPNSDNLALILNEVQNGAAMTHFNKVLTRFLPRYQRFSTRVYGGAVQLFLHESGLTSPVPATRLSDGTIRFMAILALLLSPTPPPLLCIEDPELGLHPDAVGLLADLIVEASTRMQLIVTTHSDALVSGLTDYADSVLICDYRSGTVLERVDPGKLKHWLDEYRLGDIWRIGQLGGNP